LITPPSIVDEPPVPPSTLPPAPPAPPDPVVPPPAPVLLLVEVGLDVVVEPPLPELVLDDVELVPVPPSDVSLVTTVQAPVQIASKALP
jgi:hypothetical protein